MTFKPKDYYFNKAKKENYAARSIFKLEEMDQKFKIFKSGQSVLDLGAAPGSWSQYASQKIGPNGRIIGIDLSPVNISLPNATFIQGDIHELLEHEDLNKTSYYDIVLSDMAPKTTGIRMTDQARSMELCEMALEVARKLLKPKGHLILKLFHSEDFKKLKEEIRKDFSRFEAMRPDSTRKISKEIFLLGLHKKS